MQIKYVWGALLSACIAFTGCSDDVLDEPNVTPWQEGDNIIFGARAGFQNNDQKNSRTVYKGGSYEYEGKTYERVEWVIGDNPDEISVLCPEAKVSGGGTYADYTVTSHKTEPGQHIDYATFVPAYYDKALQWGSLDQQYHFYAVYPSVHQMTDPHNPDRKGVEIKKTESGVEVVGTVPIKQKPWVVKKVDNQYIGHPMMRNAIMTATSTLDPNTGDPINLSFKSLVTALELEFVNNDYEVKTIMSVMIRSKKHNLAGKFSANLTNIVAGYPSVELLSTEAIHQIIIPLTTKEEGTNIETGLKLRTGESLKLTAFILPIDQLDDLEIVVKGLRGERSHALTSQQSGFKAHLKHYVSNINLPKSFKSSRWMSLIDDNVYLSQLSIPGTGNSYSYKVEKQNKEYEYLNTQSLSILQQWDLGIRCFELSCGHAESSDPNYNLGNISLQVGKTEISGTVSDAVRDIYDMVQDKVIDNGSGNPKPNPSPKPTEFAMVIMNYQPIPARNPEAFLKQFTNFYNSITKSADPIKTKLYKPNLTLGEVRGNILFVLRPSSDGEDDIKNLNLANVPDKCLVVNGWGSLHDKWKQRGYVTASGDPVFNCAVDKYPEQVNNTVEQLYLQKESESSEFPPQFVTPQRKAPSNIYGDIKEIGDYTYNTNQDFKVWAQEWSRVVSPALTLMTTSMPIGTKGEVYLWTHWFESYTEKLNAAKATFKRAVANKKNISAVYFNSLCGYFVEEQNATPDYRHKWSDGEETSDWGEAKGLVRAFSDKMNLDFYNFMQGEWDKSISGPMGVIIMNHVGLTENGKPKEETFLMPDMVISNNFTFGLIKSDGTPTPEPEPEPQNDPMPESDGSYSDGGWLW